MKSKRSSLITQCHSRVHLYSVFFRVTGEKKIDSPRMRRINSVLMWFLTNRYENPWIKPELKTFRVSVDLKSDGSQFSSQKDEIVKGGYAAKQDTRITRFKLNTARPSIYSVILNGWNNKHSAGRLSKGGTFIKINPRLMISLKINIVCHDKILCR